MNNDCDWPVCASCKSCANWWLLVTDAKPSSSIVSALPAFTMVSEPTPGWNTKASLPGPAMVTETAWVVELWVPSAWLSVTATSYDWVTVLAGGVEMKLKGHPTHSPP